MSADKKSLGLLSKIGIFMVAMFGITVGKVICEQKDPPQKTVSDRLMEERDARISRMLDRPANPTESGREKRKYPRALPGGGLDWSGVENAPR